MLVALIATACQADDYDRNKVPEFPGVHVYQQLDQKLQDQVKSDSLEANWAQLEEMSDKLAKLDPPPKSLIDAVRLVLALRIAADEKRCDNFAYRAVSLNLNAKGAEKVTRLNFIIKGYVERILGECAPIVEQNLEAAIKGIQDDAYTNLTSYLSDEFISQWSEKAKSEPGIGLDLKKINLELDWSRKPFNQQQLLLDQIFRLSDEHPQPDGHDMFYRTKTGEKWPKITEQQYMRSLIQTKLVKPCMSYLKQVDNNVFKLVYTATRYYGQEWGASLLDKRSAQFLAHLFRYEFCQLEVPIMTNKLWKFYVDWTKGLNAIEGKRFVKAYKSDYDRSKVPEYPGLIYYHELDELLQKNIKTDSLEANMEHLASLSDVLPYRIFKSQPLIDTVRSILALKIVDDSQRCDYLAARAVMVNLKALANAISEPQQKKAGAKDDDDEEEGAAPKQLVRLEFIIRHYVEKIMDTCEKNAEETVERSIESIEDGGYHNLTEYLSEDFISRWTERSKSVAGMGIEFGKMNQSMSWSRAAFNHQEMMLQQLFAVTKEHPQPQRGKDLYYAMNNGEKWPQLLKQQALMNLFRSKVVQPCMSYLKSSDANAFSLIYRMAKYHGKEWIDKFEQKRSKRFFVHLFRFEFCHLEVPVVCHKLWKHYWDSTRGLDIVEKREL